MTPSGPGDAFRFWAFVSYSHRDARWGDWLHRALETYRVPRRLRGRPGRDRPVPARAFPVFRDREELPGAADLATNIRTALAHSGCLIVVCSPHAARSIWVDQEIRTFKAMGREERVLCLIVDGEPNATDRPEAGLPECFPEALRYRVDAEGRLTSERTEPIAADIRPGKDGRSAARLKLLAGILGIGYDELRQRDRRRRRWRSLQGTVAAAALLAAAAGAWHLQRAEAWRTLARQSELLAERARQETAAGNGVTAMRLALEALPRSLASPDRPVVAAAEVSLFEAVAVSAWSRLLTESGGHGAPVHQARYSADGRRFVTAGDDFTARVWDAGTGGEILTLRGHGAPVVAATFDPGGDRIVTASRDTTARLWDARRGTLLATLKGHRAGVTHATFSPDGRRIVTASDDGTAAVWTVDAGAPVATLRGHTAAVTDVAFTPDGDRVATASEDHTAAIWAATTGRLLVTVRGYGRGVDGKEYSAPAASVAFGPDGRLLLVATQDNTARVWDATNGRLVAELRHGENVYGRNALVAAFGADGRQVLTASGDGRARIWHVDGGLRGTLGREPAVGHESPRILHAALSPDGARILVGYEDRTAALWDVGRGSLLAVLRGHQGRVWFTAVSPDGRRVLTASADGTARQWQASPTAGVTILEAPNAPVLEWYGPPTRSPTPGAPGASQPLFPGGNPTPGGFPFPGALAPGPSPLGPSAPGSSTPRASAPGPTAPPPVAPLSPGLGRLVGPFAPGASQPSFVRTGLSSGALSPDGARIVTASRDGLARLWDAASGAEIGVLRGHQAVIQHVAYSPDGRRIVTASQDTTARLWDGRSGASLAVLRGHQDGMMGWRSEPGARPLEWGVASAVFALAGDRVVTASHDGSARVWDAADGRQRHVLRGHRGPVHWAEFSPDGRRIVTASGDGTVGIWETETAHQLHALTGHAGSVLHAVFDRAGRWIASGSQDGTGRVWDAQDGREVAVLRGHAGPVWRVAFAPDGRRVVTASFDYTARLWDARTAATLAIFRGHQGPVTSAAFAGDGLLLATASVDGSARLWDGATGTALAALLGHEGPIVHVDIGGKADRLLTVGGTGDGTARVWWLPPRGQPLVDLARHRLPSRR